MRFVKAHGAGNDFVLLPDLDDAVLLTPRLVRALCDRHHGLGGDGVLRVGPGPAGSDAEVFMDYRNADGSVVEMCGNGVRCVAKYVLDRGLVAGSVVRVATRDGIKAVEAVDRHADGCVATVRVDMGAPHATGSAQVDVSPLQVATSAASPASPPGADPVMATATAERRLVDLTTVSMGNPHAVMQVPDVDDAPVRTWGPVIERHERFPAGTNVEFIAVTARDRVVGRIWERGVGETQASGTGASAMAVAAHLLGLADRRVVVALPGGELEVDWTSDSLYVTGPAAEVAAGALDEGWLAQIGPL